MRRLPGVALCTSFLVLVAGTGVLAADRPLQSDLATTWTYTNDPVVARQTVALQTHITELRSAVALVRQQAGLASFAWTDPQPSRVRGVYIRELRTALEQAFAALRRPAPAWSEPIVAGGVLKATHLQEIRNATRWEANGTVMTNATWPLAGSPYVIQSDVHVASGVTLTIAAGVVVKFMPGTSLYVREGATLLANGTEQQPIVFTSVRDDAYGGDTNRDETATAPAGGDWHYFWLGSFNGSSQPAFGTLSNVIVRYGHEFRVRHSRPSLQSVTAENMNNYGLYLESPPQNGYTIDRLTLRNNLINLGLNNVPAGTTISNAIIRGARATAVQAENNTRASITRSSIDNNAGNSVIWADATSPMTLRYNSVTNNRASNGAALGIHTCCAGIDARENWWGSTSGPEIIGQGEAGGGSQINGNNVQYDPWLGKPWAGGFRMGHHPWSLKAGVGTDVVTGNFFMTEADFSIETLGFPLEVRRTYNSRNAGPVVNELGVGWSWNYGTRLMTQSDSHGVVWQREDGTSTYFKRNPDDTFSGEEGIYEKLVWRPSNNNYALTRKDQSVLIFEPSGRLAVLIDPSGNPTSILRDPAGRVTAVHDAMNQRALSFTYGGDGYIWKITDPIGRTYEYQRHANGAISSVTKKDGFGSVFATAIYVYGSGGPWEMLAFVDADGNQLSQSFDASFRVARQTFNGNEEIRFVYEQDHDDSTGYYVGAGQTGVWDSRGRIHLYGYMPNGKVIAHLRETSNWSFVTEDWWTYSGYLATVHDHQDGSTSSTYDWNSGNLTRLTEPGGRVTTHTYDAWNNRTSTTDNAGRTTYFQYDGNHRPIRIQDPANAVTTHTYYSNGRLHTTTDGRGKITTYTWDALGYPASVINPEGETTRYIHDGAGRKLLERTPLGAETRYTYDGRNNVLTSTDPLENLTINEYDAHGRRTRATDAEWRSTYFTYDAAKNQLSRITDLYGNYIELTRDTYGGNVTAVRAPNGNYTYFSYDDLNRRIAESDAFGNTWIFQYTGKDRLSSVLDPLGARTYYYYNSHNQLSQITHSDNQVVTYGYDGVGNRTVMNDWNGQTLWTYDRADRVTRCTTNGQETSYGYDAVGNLTSIQWESGKPVQYTYDSANRMKTVTDWQGRVTTYGYDGSGRRTSIALPNAVSTSLAYDAANRTTSITHSRGFSTVASFAYSYDRVGNPLSKRRADGLFESYQYDALHRLTRAHYPNPLRVVDYAYDGAGNRTWKSESYNGGTPFASSYGYDAADRSTSDWAGLTYHNANGALTAQGSRSLYWNAQHLLGALYDGQVFHGYVYDGDGRRVSQTTNGIYTSYVVDTVPEHSDVLRSASIHGTYHYIYGHDLLYRIDANDNVHYLHADVLGSVTNATNSNGTSALAYQYDVFGFPWEGGGIAEPHLFTGEEYDPSGLIYLRARYYDPRGGRFVSRDPISLNLTDTQSLNRYTYVRNRPTVLTDPSGNIPAAVLPLVFAAGGALAGVVNQAITDYRAPGPRSGLGAYVNAGTRGGLQGAALFFGGAYGPALSAATGAAYDQGGAFVTRKPVDWNEFAETTILESFPGMRAPGVNVGRNSLVAVSKQLRTKYLGGQIRNVRPSVAARSAAGVFYDALSGGIAGNALKTLIDRLPKLRRR
jgi:RHS repeat-associated protein